MTRSGQRPPPTRAIVAAGLIAAAAIAWLGWPRADAPATPSAPTRADREDRQPRDRSRPAPDVGGAAAPAELAPPDELPGSLAGADADGAVTADAAGHLVIDLELRRLFDHFLAASGEEPIGVLRARIVAVLRGRLPPLAAGEAIDVLDAYLAYREAARTLASPASELAGLAQLHDLRARSLPPAVTTAFFAEEEAAIYAALARREVAADPALSAAERERRLAEIDARAPVAVREARAAALAPVAELARETELRAAGATDQQIAELRTAQLGSAAAARLGALDQAHAAWDARLAQFRTERAALLADPRLDDSERTRRIAALLARSFTAPERLRVETLDRLAGTAAH